MVSQLENAGLSFVGSDETGRRMEVGIILNDDCASAFSIVRYLVFLALCLELWFRLLN